MEIFHEIEAHGDLIRASAARALEGIRDADEVGEIALDVCRLSEKTLRIHPSFAESRLIACGPGCGTCCILNVSVLFPEAVGILRFMKDNFREGALQGTIGRIRDLSRDTRWLDDEERILCRRPCALLDRQKRCMVHPVRPLLCRSITSTDPEQCRDAVVFHTFGEKSPVLMNLFQKGVMEATFRGFGRALAERGMDSRGIRLTEALNLLLDREDFLQGYIEGEKLPH